MISTLDCRSGDLHSSPEGITVLCSRSKHIAVPLLLSIYRYKCILIKSTGKGTGLKATGSGRGERDLLNYLLQKWETNISTYEPLGYKTMKKVFLTNPSYNHSSTLLVVYSMQHILCKPWGTITWIYFTGHTGASCNITGDRGHWIHHSSTGQGKVLKCIQI